MKKPESKWLPIPGYEGFYEASTSGLIWRVKSQIVSAGSIRKGYRATRLYKNGIGKGFQVHRLILMTHGRMPQKGEQCNHIDENKSNNAIDNLEWCTPAENTKHSTSRMVDATMRAKNGHKKPVPDLVKMHEHKDKEVWRKVIGHPDYIVSNWSRLKSYRRNHRGNILTPCLRNDAYINYQLGRGNNVMAHKLVYEAFKGPTPKDFVIDHIDGNKLNNHLSNLQAISRGDNTSLHYIRARLVTL